MVFMAFLVLFLIFLQSCYVECFIRDTGCSSFMKKSKVSREDFPLFATLKKRQFHITTVDGLEEVLAKEIQSKISDIENLQVQKKGVTFTGTSKSGFEALLWLRTCLKVMEKIDISHIGAENDQIYVYNKDDLYDFISLIDWKSMINYDQTIKCDATISSTTSPTLTHTHFTALTIKNAIIDQFRNHYKDDTCRPDVDLDNPMLPLLLYLHRNEVFLYRIWSGDQSMHKRGYRSDSVIHKASLRETTAAGIVLKSGWDAQKTFLCDPMCGSGTIPIEAALIATNTAPGLLRYSLADVEERKRPVPLFWKDIQSEEGVKLWKTVWQEALVADKRKQTKGKIIFGNDLIRGSLELARSSAARAGVSHLIDFCNKDIIDYYLPSVEEDSNDERQLFTVVTNPPWDKRLEASEDGSSWDNLNEFLFDSSPSLDRVYILNGNPSLTRYIRSKPQKKHYLNAANTPMELLVYKFPEKVKNVDVK